MLNLAAYVDQMIKKLRNDSLLWLSLIALLSRLIYLLLSFTSELRLESITFDDKAATLASGKLLGYPALIGSFHIFLAPIYKFLQIFQLTNYRVVIICIINAILATIATALVYMTLQRIFPQRSKMNTLITVAFILYYPYLYFNGLILSENLFIPIIIAILYLSLTTKRYGFIGLLLGIGVVIRPISLLFVPLYILWLLFETHNNWRKKLINILAICGSALVVMTGTSFINYLSDSQHQFTYAANGGLNFVASWCDSRRVVYLDPNGLEWWVAPPVNHGLDPDLDLYVSHPLYDNQYYLQTGLKCLNQHPQKLITNIAHAGNLINSVFYPNVATFTPIHNELLALWKFIIGVLLVFFSLYPLIFRRARKLWLLSMFFLFSIVFAVYLANPGEERYLMPAVAPILIFGIPVLIKILNYIKFRIMQIKRLEQLLLVWLILLITLIPVSYGLTLVFIANVNHLKRPIQLYETLSQADLQQSYNQAVHWLASEVNPDNLAAALDLTAAGEYLNDNAIKKQGITLLTEYKYSAKDLPQLLLAQQNYSQNKDQINELAHKLLLDQNSDGSFGSGIMAIAACGEMYRFTHEKTYLNCLGKASKYYFSQLQENFDLTSAAWQLIAYKDLPEFTAQSEYIYVHLIRLQRNTNSYAYNIGSFQTSDGASTDSLVVYAMIGNKKYQKYIDRGIYNLWKLQIRDTGAIRENLSTSSSSVPATISYIRALNLYWSSY